MKKLVIVLSLSLVALFAPVAAPKAYACDPLKTPVACAQQIGQRADRAKRNFQPLKSGASKPLAGAWNQVYNRSIRPNSNTGRK